MISTVQGSDHLVEIDGVAHRFSRDDAGLVRAPAASLVVAVDIAPGDDVEIGTRLAILEAMKMEIAINATVAGRVRDVFVAKNVQVDAGAPLFRIEAAGDSDLPSSVGSRIDLEGLPGEPSGVDELDLVLASLLGLDVDSSRALAEVARIDRTDRGAVEVLGTFADLCAVAPERRESQCWPGAAGSTSMPTFGRSTSTGRAPHVVRGRLLRALGHYGVIDLEPGPQLEDALLRIFMAQQRRDEQLPIVMALLDGPLPEDGLRETLDHLVETTRRRFPSIAGLSRAVRHSVFDRPVIDRTRAETSAQISELARPDRRVRRARSRGP